MKRLYTTLILLLLLLVILLMPIAVISQSPTRVATPSEDLAAASPLATDTPSPSARTCPDIVLLALRTTEELCEGIGRNKACYGHVLVEALPQHFATNFNFEKEGDTVDLFSLRSIRLSSMDLETSLWGVAMMNLLSFSTYASPSDVTLLMFGDVDIENRVEPATELEIVTTSAAWVNVRLAPSIQAGVIGTLAPSSTVTATGRLSDNSWIRVIMPDDQRVGWLSEIVLRDTDAVEELDVIEPFSPYYGPMQAFYFQSGVDDAICAQAPESGLVIQTPEGVAEVSLLVNEVNIQLSSTAFLQAQPGSEMTVSVLDGWARLKTTEGEQTAFAGMQVSVPLNDDLTPSGRPETPTPYSLSNLVSLPVTLLNRVIDLADPLTEEQIVLIVEALASGGTYDPSTGTITTGDSENGGGGRPIASPPGLDGVIPPGHGGTPPGQGGEPPGQVKNRGQ